MASSMPERGEGRVDAALEAVAGVGVDAQPAAGAGGADRVEVGRLDEDVGGGLGDSRCAAPPMTPPMLSGPLASQTSVSEPSKA